MSHYENTAPPTYSPSPNQGQPHPNQPAGAPPLEGKQIYSSEIPSPQPQSSASYPQQQQQQQQPTGSYTMGDPSQQQAHPYPTAEALPPQQPYPPPQQQSYSTTPPAQQKGQQPYPMQQMNKQAGGEFQTAIPLTNLNRAPAPVDCPLCGKRALTTCITESGGFTHMLAAVLCICLCLGCIPYCIDGTKDVVHKCGSCGGMLAVWHRSGGQAEVVAHH